MVGGYQQRDDTNKRWDETLSPTAVVDVLLDSDQGILPCRIPSALQLRRHAVGSHRRFS